MNEPPKDAWTAPTVEDDSDHKAGGRGTENDGHARFVQRRDGASVVRKTEGGTAVETKMVLSPPSRKAKARTNGRTRSDSELSAKRAKSLVETTREMHHRMVKARRAGAIDERAFAAVTSLVEEIERAVGKEIRRRRR